MLITYATVHKWRKEVMQDPLSLFGNSEKKKLTEILKKVADSDITYSIEVLEEEFFDWWFPMYLERINTKDNPTIFDVKGKTLSNPVKDKKYFSLTLLEGEDKIGGLIFSVKGNTLFFAYRSLAYDWRRAILRGSPSLYVEYVIAGYAKTLGLKYISHGRDRNPYGVNSSIGLALFKLSTGCLPRLSKQITLEVFDTEGLNKDALIFECPEPAIQHTPITKVYLIASLEGQKKWSQIERFSDVLDIEIITRPTI